MLGNPIIEKELIQAAHHRRTWVVRAGLPALAAALLLPQVYSLLTGYGQDWRALAELTRPLFLTLAWLQFIALPLLAFSLAASALRQEWMHRTVEVLCTTPLSAAGIVYGKFAAALSQVLMAALALLPVTAVLYFVSRLPREVALGSFAIIIGTVLLFASLGLLQGAGSRGRERTSANVLLVLLLVWGGVATLDAFVWVRHPLLEALFFPRALYLVLQGRAPKGLTTGQFALLTSGMLVVGSVGALALAPRLFRFTITRGLGAAKAGRKVTGLRRLVACRRPPMKPAENPLVWQEKGSATRVLRLGVWVLYGIAVAVFFVGGMITGGLGLVGDFYGILFGGGLLVISLGSALYGARVFAREKSQRTAQALLLTGRSPREFFLAKIRAVYWALRYSLVAVAALTLAMWYVSGRQPWSRGEEVVGYLVALEALLLAPALGTLVGMVFSSVAKSPRQAVQALLLSLVWQWFLGGMMSMLSLPLFMVVDWEFVFPLVSLIPSVVILAVFWRVTRRWTAWRLSVLLALSFIICSNALTSVALLMGSLPGASMIILLLLVGHALVGALALMWWRLGLSIFDAGMAQEPVGASRASYA